MPEHRARRIRPGLYRYRDYALEREQVAHFRRATHTLHARYVFITQWRITPAAGLPHTTRPIARTLSHAKVDVDLAIANRTGSSPTAETPPRSPPA